jgi:hypothetical protein
MIQMDSNEKSSKYHYENKIHNIEQKYISNTINYIDYIEYIKLDEIQKKISNYKLIVSILYSNPEFYLDLKQIQIDYFRELNEVVYLEIIWNIEHYEYIEQIRTCENDIMILAKFANKYNLISFIQYHYVKKFLKKINNIFESDKSIQELYDIDYDILSNISKNSIELFFNIVDIILLKINLIKKSHIKTYEILNIANNNKYTNLIGKIKSNLEKINTLYI